MKNTVLLHTGKPASSIPAKTPCLTKASAALVICGGIFCAVFLAASAANDKPDIADEAKNHTFETVFVSASADEVRSSDLPTSPPSVWDHLEGIIADLLGRAG